MTMAERFPGAVIEAWNGLGYNRRAVNLYQAAARLGTNTTAASLVTSKSC